MLLQGLVASLQMLLEVVEALKDRGQSRRKASHW